MGPVLFCTKIWLERGLTSSGSGFVLWAQASTGFGQKQETISV
jgi:hypothetical protein